MIFSALYYYRPEDFIPGLNYIPMAKIAGVIGAVALIVGMMGAGRANVPRAVKILWLLLHQMTLCVPFAIWRGGAFSTVFERFDKWGDRGRDDQHGCGHAAGTPPGAVDSGERSRASDLFSVILNHTRDGRLEGIQKSILENPNDLAVNIAISFPLGLAFMLQARGFRKVIGRSDWCSWRSASY